MNIMKISGTFLIAPIYRNLWMGMALIGVAVAEEPRRLSPAAMDRFLEPGGISGQITSAYRQGFLEPSFLPIAVDPKEGAARIELLPGGGDVFVETTEKSQALENGTIILSAADAAVIGQTAKLESNPGNYRIGFWTNAEDRVSWAFAFGRWGRHEVELTYSLAGTKANSVEVRVGQESILAEIPPTGSWYRYETIRLGSVYVEQEGKRAIVVRGTDLRGPAVMNLKALTLRPTWEGGEVWQAEDGSVKLLAKEARVFGTKLRYEPQPKKNCVGYWVNPKDWAEWRFHVSKPGRYALRIHQGCGKGSGGSEVELSLAGQVFPFQVEDTGHFQNFVPRELGTVSIDTAGWQKLEVRAKRKPGVAVMDIQSIELTPL